MNKANREFNKVFGYTLLIAVCVGWITAATAAEKVSARTVTHTGARSGSILSNKVQKVDIPLSVFEDAQERKDPFFPNAEYRLNTAKKSENISGGMAFLKQLKLTGFGGIGNKRWAMINGVSIYQNESAKIGVGGQFRNITCLEMKDNSVTIGIKGGTARHELKLDN